MKKLSLILSCLLLPAVALAQGAPKLHVRVDGPGYLRFVRDGRAVYAKDVVLTVQDGEVRSESGLSMLPAIAVPATPSALSVGADGTLTADGSTLGRLRLAIFAPGAPLIAKDGMLVAADRPTMADAGTAAAGSIKPFENVVATTKVEPAAPALPKTKVTEEAPPTKPVTNHPNPDLDGKGALPAGDMHLGITIKVAAYSEVESEKFTLADVAQIEAPESVKEQLSQIEMGDTPPFGVEKIVDRQRVVTHLKSAGFDPKNAIIILPSVARMARKGQHVRGLDFADKAIEEAKTQFGSDVSFKATSVGPDTILPLGKLEFVVESMNATGKNVVATVGSYVDGQRISGRTVTLLSSLRDILPKVGQMVKLVVISNLAEVDTVAKVQHIDEGTRTVQVVTKDGTTLTGHVSAEGVVEVRL